MTSLFSRDLTKLAPGQVLWIIAGSMTYDGHEIVMLPRFKLVKGFDLEKFIEWMISEIWTEGRMAYRSGVHEETFDIMAVLATGEDPYFWRGSLSFRSTADLCMAMDTSSKGLAALMLDKGSFGLSAQAQKTKQNLKDLIGV